jgi:mRNA-binding protein PUF3
VQVEKKLYRYDRVDSPTMRDPDSSEAPPTPALSSTPQSPKSSSIPSTNASTVDDPVHSTTPIAQKDVATLIGGVSIENTA